ncbi:hypothetical protein SAMN04490189_3183 [Pseudomonas koreensis]|jgi:hypothetical protein|uniref:Uncharacterized protein n=1 Tax=Pseudomonas koreensis TaxID=198620 RepID=A0AAC9FZT6_9PSED|nr:hypothetical protein [Pseudomonas koreensis]ANI00196.1 hypothetical protein A8L59_23200 [Pseudomonas koreensis]KAB0511650.1 hypothetical protein F7R05_19615 [Pseudomonas koreensis]MCM8740612.1 hypothetical protein [Pseudomonas koreensis]NNA58694.1 hypothetical protein [Pseudomonas koreensis]NNA64623.1 hypothetical protein [Pseudomonas koreensis]
MTVYEDEWAFWDDIAGKYIFKHADTDQNVSKVIEAAGVYADLMVVARRKRRAGRIPEGDMPRVSVTAASFRMDGASK